MVTILLLILHVMIANTILWFYLGFHRGSVDNKIGDFILWLFFGIPLVIAYVAFTTRARR